MHSINYIRDNSIEFDNAMNLRGEKSISSKILEIDYEQAEYVKIIKGNLSFTNEEKFKVDLPCGEHKIITSNFLQGIIKPRYEEIIEMCRNTLEENLISRIGMDTIVFSGGGAEIKGFQEFSSKILNRRVRVAKPFAFHKDIGKPEFSTLNGLIKICNDLTFKNLLLNKSIQNDNGILAIVSDYKIPDISLPIFNLDEISNIADFILNKTSLK